MNITGEGIAKLYLENMYKWFGIPSKLYQTKIRDSHHISQPHCANVLESTETSPQLTIPKLTGCLKEKING